MDVLLLLLHLLEDGLLLALDLLQLLGQLVRNELLFSFALITLVNVIKAVAYNGGLRLLGSFDLPFELRVLSAHLLDHLGELRCGQVGQVELRLFVLWVRRVRRCLPGDLHPMILAEFINSIY